METSAERLKALPHLTVALLQEALHRGFAQIGHRNLPVLSQKMEAMTWKTAPSKHIEAFSLVEGVLFALLSICSNGLIPDAMLVAASGLYNSIFLIFGLSIFKFLLRVSSFLFRFLRL